MCAQKKKYAKHSNVDDCDAPRVIEIEVPAEMVEQNHKNRRASEKIKVRGQTSVHGFVGHAHPLETGILQFAYSEAQLLILSKKSLWPLT